MIAAKIVTGCKGLIPIAVGGGMTIAAILGQAGGQINESTGIAIGFVGGVVVTVASLAWFFRGYLDGLKAEVKRVETEHANEIKTLKHDNERLKRKIGID
jgi:hypothetical protein